MHSIIKASEMRKIREMTEKSAKMREEERIMRDKELHPYKGTNYPANYRTYIPTPIPPKVKTSDEEYREALRSVPQKITSVREESSPARFG